MNRSLAVARIHAMDHANVFVLPWAVLASSFVINVIIWLLLPEAAAHGSGGILSLYGLVVAMISVQISRGFPFQVGFGVTRRDFLTGTLLLVALYSLGSAVILTSLNLIEGATSGFGLGGRFFRAPWFTDVPDVQLLVIYALPMVFFAGLGMLYSAIWSRYKTTGIAVLTIASALAVVLMIALVTWRDAWSSVGSWFATFAPLTAVLVMGALGVLAMAASWLTLRRAPV
jgi:hypothetical protein